jgi:NADPH:quinone reductase-like Zn-dependent oxidoreductase
MEAIVFNDFGPATNLQPATIPDPVIQADQVLVKVKAIGVNPVEVAIRSGMAFTEPFEKLEHKVLGWDIAGVVTQAGSKVTNFREGDPVLGMIDFPQPTYGYAEYVAAPADRLARIPDTISYQEAAGATLAALTAYQGLVHYGNVQHGHKVVILNASGGVGHYGVQIAKHSGATVIGTASAAKADFLQKLGVDQHVDYRQHTIDEVVQDADVLLHGAGVDVDQALNAVKRGGRVISLIPTASDLEAKAEQQGKTGQLIMVQPSGADMQAIADLLASGAMASHIEAAYPLREAYKAHQHLEEGHTSGKVVLTVPD